MNFKEFLAKLGSAASKTLAEAKTLLAECATHLAAAVAELDLKIEALALADTALTATRSELATANANLVTANASISTITAERDGAQATALDALAKAGIKVAKFDADDIKAAAKARAEAIGHELLAARGTKPLPEQVNNPGETESKAETDDQILAKYEAMPVGQVRLDFFTKHEAAIWRAWKK